MKLLALVEGCQHVCCRYRLVAYEPALRGAGIEVEYVVLAPRAVARWRQLRRLPHDAVVLLQRKLLPLWQQRQLRRRAAALVYDFDDAVFLRDSYSARGPFSARRLRRFQNTVALADLVWAGNDFLAAHARRHRDGPVLVVPTALAPANYPPARHDARRSLRLVWIGSASTAQCFQRAAALLDDVARRVPDVTLRVICDRFPTLEHLQVEARPWSSATEAAELADADVGISWLPDDDWSRGKCGLKVLQYMAAGLPVVANPVGVQRAMVRHGVTGYLADSADEWVSAVAALANDPARRRAFGARAREIVQSEYSVERWAGEIVSSLQGLHARSTPALQGASR